MTDLNPQRKIVIGSGIPVPGNDIDTDRIIPARYMKCVTFAGLEEHVFFDERFDQQGHSKNHPFNDERYQNGSILIVNQNFGCGSSREHAPQALVRFGVTGIIGESFAEIFAGNCAAMGIPTVTATGRAISSLMAFAQEQPDAVIRIDLEKKAASCNQSDIPVDIPECTRQGLLKGTWDTTAQLLAHKEAIEKTASRIPYMNKFAS